MRVWKGGCGSFDGAKKGQYGSFERKAGMALRVGWQVLKEHIAEVVPSGAQSVQ